MTVNLEYRKNRKIFNLEDNINTFKYKSKHIIGSGQPGAKLRPIDWSCHNLEPFQKNLLANGTLITSMTTHEMEIFYQKNEMNASGNNVPHPVKTFQEAGFPEYILTEFTKAGFKIPTPIQSQGWPMALTGRDVVGIAQTGSGKTIAFGLPALMHICAQPPLKNGEGPISLCIAPTRELAMQIEKDMIPYSSACGIKIACVYGGAPKREQIFKMRQGIEFLICTPGRLLDFLERGIINLYRVTYLVFDEADRMLDMGFEPQIRALVSQIRPDRQVLMWSATWPKEVQQLAEDFLPNDKLMIRIGLNLNPCKNVTQIVKVVNGKYEKDELLVQALQEYNRGKTIVFTGTKRMADQLSTDLNRQGFYSESIHGDKRQEERERVLANLKSGKINVMVATDVAARGIHVKDIICVFNFDFPQNCEDYIHRIGRTGRAGAKGVAITMFDKNTDKKKANRLVNILKKASAEIPPELYSIANFESQGYENFRSRVKF